MAPDKYINRRYINQQFLLPRLSSSARTNKCKDTTTGKKEYKTDNPTVSLSHIIQFKFIPILIFLESNYFNVSCNPRFNLNLEVEERIGNHNISLNKSHLSSGFCQD